MYVQRTEVNTDFFLYISSSCFWCGVSHSAWSSLIWACVASKWTPGILLSLHTQWGAHGHTTPQLAYTGACVTSMLPPEASPQPLVCYNFREELSCVTGQVEHRVTKQNISASVEQEAGDFSHMFLLGEVGRRNEIHLANIFFFYSIHLHSVGYIKTIIDGLKIQVE